MFNMRRKQNIECNCADRSFKGTWTTIELNEAINKGYEILKIYQVMQFNTKQYII